MPVLAELKGNKSIALGSDEPKIFFYFSHLMSKVVLLEVDKLCGHIELIEPFSAMLAQKRLAECDEPGINPSKYSSLP